MTPGPVTPHSELVRVFTDAYWARPDFPDGEPATTLGVRIADGLAAVRPLIAEEERAGERTRIADAIEAARLDPRLHGNPGGRPAEDWLSGVHDGLRRAALIARGNTA